jgi:hypothetical protein
VKYDIWTEFARKQIEDSYNVKLQDGYESLRKFGRGTCYAKQTKTTLMTQMTSVVDNETYTTADLVDTLSSTAANVATIGVEGYTIDSSGDMTYVEQDVTMSGTTGVTLSTPLSRITRMFTKEKTFATPTSSVAVNVYASESTNTGLSSGAPSSVTYCKAIMPGGVNQTEKAATCTANNEYAVVHSVCATLPEAASPTGTAAADISLEVKRKGGVFRPAGLELAVGAQQRTGVVPFEPPVIVPPNSDFRLVASASTTDLVVTGVINGVKFKEQGV